MKRARYRVQDPLTFPGEPPASYRLSEWRKVDRDPGTRMPRWACYWLRHGHRAQLAGYIWVNDPRVLQVRYAAYGPLGGMIESTQHHGRSMMTGGTVRRARARVDAILMGGFVWDPQEPDRAVLSPALAASYDDGCRPLPAPPVRPPSSAPSRLPGPELWREEGLFPGREAGAPRPPGGGAEQEDSGDRELGPDPVRGAGAGGVHAAGAARPAESLPPVGCGEGAGGHGRMTAHEGSSLPEEQHDQ